MDKLPFPQSTWGSGIDEATVDARMQGFNTWLREVLTAVLDARAAEAETSTIAEQQLCAFLAPDNSCTEDVLLSLGMAPRSAPGDAPREEVDPSNVSAATVCSPAQLLSNRRLCPQPWRWSTDP